MTDAGFDAIVFEDALEAWCDQLNRIGIGKASDSVAEPLTLRELEAASSEDSGGLADMGVMLLRLLASAELRSRAEDLTAWKLALLGYPRALPADVLQDRSDFELVAGCLRWLVLR